MARFLKNVLQDLKNEGTAHIAPFLYVLLLLGLFLLLLGISSVQA